MGDTKGLLPKQGENGIFNVLDELALVATSKDDIFFAYTSPEVLAQRSFLGDKYSAQDFLDKFVKPIHISTGPFETIVYPDISNDFIKAANESGNSATLLRQAPSILLNSDSLNEGLARVEKSVDVGISLTKNPASLLGWLLSQYFAVMVWLPRGTCNISTPAFGQLIDRPLSPNEISAKNKILGWLQEVS